MITVHHLSNSRSQRVLWLLEELGAPYEIRRHQRDPVTRMAPAEMKALHPLGKAPLITDDGRPIAESGAIVDYVIRRYGNGRLQPDPQSPLYDDYQQWLHYSEGSAMAPLMLQVSTARLGEAAAPLRPRIDEEVANHLRYFDNALAGGGYLVGDGLTGADIQMSFVAELAEAFGRLAPYSHIARWLARMQARPAYVRALEIGGPYALGAAVTPGKTPAA